MDIHHTGNNTVDFMPEIYIPGENGNVPYGHRKQFGVEVKVTKNICAVSNKVIFEPRNVSFIRIAS